MTTLRLRQTVPQNHQLHLVLPPDFPVGEVEVTVRSTAADAPPANVANNPADQVAKGRAELQVLFAMIDALPASSKRSTEEIDRSIAEERASWD